jgi:hypothetical protein
MPNGDVVYTGWLKKGETPNTIIAEIKDKFGWPIILTGVLDPATRTYALTGTLGPTPASLHIATIDGPRAECGTAKQRCGTGGGTDSLPRIGGPRAGEPAG